MVSKNEIREHAEVIARCGSYVGIVDHMYGDDTIKLTRNDVISGGKHRFIPLDWVERIEGNQVILNRDKDEVTW